MKVSLEEAMKLLDEPDMDTSQVTETVIGVYHGKIIEVDGFTSREFFHLGCLKSFGVRDLREDQWAMLDKIWEEYG